MSVKQVKAISIIGMMSDLDKVVKLCGDSQIFHPDDAMKFYSDTQNFVPLHNKNSYSEYIQQLENSAELLGFKLAYKKPKDLSAGESAVVKYVSYFVSKTKGLADRKLSLQQKIDSCKRDIEKVGHFLGSHIDFTQVLQCEFITPNFGRMPTESYDKLSQYADNPYVLFFPYTSDSTHYWGAYFTPPEQKEEINRIFSSLYFEKFDIPPSAGTPEQYKSSLEKQLDGYEQELEEVQNKIDDFLDDEKEKCCAYYSKLQELDSYNEIKRYVCKYNKNFVLTGWIPAENAENFSKQLDSIKSVEYSVTDGKDLLKLSPPVIMKNPPFVRLYEFYVKMYGMPNYNEVDPTLFVAITYTLFFGIMFGDVGQGLTLAIVGFLMWKFKKMEIGKILIPCGISGTIFGFLYGSVFGFEHALDSVHSALFGTKGKLFEVMEADSINMIIYGSVVIGFVTIAASMLVNIFSSLKRKDLENALFSANGVAGFLFYVSLVVGLVLQMFFGIPVMNPVYIIFLIAIPLVAIFLKEPLGMLIEKKKHNEPFKWGEYCMQSFFEVFEVCLSYVTNTMSFLRVGAYILVHAGMMLVVFTLANMAGNAVGYTIALVLGNGVVMALEALLVAIQVLRLDYYEVFSRFYIGEGRAFQPITAKKLKTEN